MAVHDVDGIVDVQRHRGRRARVADAVGIDHGVGQAHHLAQGSADSPSARHGRLRAQIGAAVRKRPQASLKPGSVRR